MESRRTVPPYHDTLQHQTYGYGDMLQPDDGAQVEYYQAQSTAAFRQNKNIPGFSPAVAASSIPPLPIFEAHDRRSYEYAAEAFRKDGRFLASGSHTPHSNPSNQSPFHLPPNLSSSRKPNIATSHASAAQIVEEGELSEGEFEESQPEMNRNSIPVYRTAPPHELNRGRHVSTYRTAHRNMDENEIKEAQPRTG
jgi:hypothetical protein